MEVEESHQELTSLLVAAASGNEEALKAFFRALPDAYVYVPVFSPAPIQDEQIVVIGEKGEVPSQVFMTVRYEGNPCVPAFTEKRFVEQWAKREVLCVSKLFRTLLWSIGEGTWIYLNPNQEVGKEITPWEIELLKQGADAVDDLVAAQQEDSLDEIEVSPDTESFAELKRKLIPVLEIYSELEEAFLVMVKEGMGLEPRPVLGLRFAKNTSQNKREYLREEILRIADEYQGAGEQPLAVLDDLGLEHSPNWPIFSEAVPFYLAQKEVPSKEQGVSVWIKLKRLFRKAKTTSAVTSKC